MKNITIANTTPFKTVRDMVRWATSQFNEANLFYGHGTDNAWDEAVTLVFFALHLTHDLYNNVLDARLTVSEIKDIINLVKKRVQRKMPLSYLTHQAWFCDLPFYVDERVLIPRSPIAELIQEQFAPWIELENIHHILDLCTGSGCIAIACASLIDGVQCDASDISAEALAVAAINVEKLNVGDQVTLIQSDLFKNIPAKKYDIIVSNPPYVDAEDMATLPDEFLHEPKKALAAGQDGLKFATKILKEAADYLSPQGILIVEVGNSEVALAELFPDVPFTWLEFANGGGGVFLLTYSELNEYQSRLKKS